MTVMNIDKICRKKRLQTLSLLSLDIFMYIHVALMHIQYEAIVCCVNAYTHGR